MHELAICQSVIDTVLDRTGAARVTVLSLVVGRLSGVVPEALRFAFGLVAEGTPLQDADLRIEEPAGRGRCRTCGADLELDDPVVLCRCGSLDVHVTAGRELLIRSVEVV